jgi:hypothetical protein
MALRIRKSFSLGKGVHMNVGKSGVGLSFGGKGLRYSVHSSGRRTSTVGIPGSGLSYSKTSTTGKRRYSSAAYARREQIKLERELQKQNELRQNQLIVDEYTNTIEMITGVHKECDEPVDWAQIHSLPAPFQPPDVGPKQQKAMHELQTFSPKWYERWFPSLGEKRKHKLEAAAIQAEAEDAQDYEEWKSLNELSGRVLQGDVDAYFQVIEEMNPLDDLLEFGSDFEFGTDDSSVIEVEFRVKSETVVPNYALSLTKTGKLSRKDLTKSRYFELVQDYVCSCALRIARDMTALLPVEKVVVHAVDTAINTATGHEEEITLLSVVIDRTQLNGLNFEHIDPSDALQSFRCQMKFAKTSGFKPVERIEEY